MSTLRFARGGLRATLALFVLLLCSGCFTYETLITLNLDGSGTVEEVFTLSGSMLEFMTMFAEEGDEAPDFCDEDELAAQAAEMGEGVTLTSATPIDGDSGVGCRAVFAFTDVNTLQINQDPGERIPDGGLDSDEDEEEDTPVTFSYTPGNLTIYMPQDFGQDDDEDDDTAAEPDSAARAMQFQMMREMFKGAHMRLALAVEGDITETNATYLGDDGITLIELDFDTLLEDEAQMMTMMDAKPNSAEEIRALVEGVDGIKVETTEEVTIQFE